MPTSPRSRKVPRQFAGVEEETEPLRRFLNFWHAVKWLDLSDAEEKALQGLFDGNFGQPFPVAAGLSAPNPPAGYQSDTGLFDAPQQLATAAPAWRRRRTMPQSVEFCARRMRSRPNRSSCTGSSRFPACGRTGPMPVRTAAFDAVIGNPPWDRMKLQEVEWFAARVPEIAHAQRASDRKRMVKNLQDQGDPTAADHARAAWVAEIATRVARGCGAYPLLSGGDVNIYSLFIERA